MVYAPIIIPTLNRRTHLERCIMSLRNNSWAKYSDLYISVDYPPNDNYTKGHEQVKAYLRTKISGFNNVEVFYQNKNLGPYENMNYLIRYVSERYDRYIYMDDDIETSPNFIEFMDKALMEFFENEKIIGVCGCGAGHEHREGNTMVVGKNFASWGVGHWVHKDIFLKQYLHRKYYVDKTKQIDSVSKLIKGERGLFLALQSLIRKKEKLYYQYPDELPMFDVLIKMICIWEDYYAVFPSERKTRTWGYDGSGVNCGGHEGNSADSMEIDESDSFECYYETPMIEVPLPENKSIDVMARIIVGLVKLLWWRVFDGT